MPNQKRLEMFNKEYQHFYDRVISNKYYTVTQTCTTDCKVGSTNKSFKNSMKPITIKEMTQKVKVSEKTIKRELATLQELGILTREGGRKDGRWVMLVPND